MLQRSWSYADLVDRHIRVNSCSVVGVDGLDVRVEIVVREFPKLALVTEGLFGQRSEHYFNELSKKSAIVFVGLSVFIPVPNCCEVGSDFQLVNPSVLVSPNNANSEAPPSHVVEGGNLFCHAQRVMGG